MHWQSLPYCSLLLFTILKTFISLYQLGCHSTYRLIYVSFYRSIYLQQTQGLAHLCTFVLTQILCKFELINERFAINRCT